MTSLFIESTQPQCLCKGFSYINTIPKLFGIFTTKIMLTAKFIKELFIVGSIVFCSAQFQAFILKHACTPWRPWLINRADLYVEGHCGWDTLTALVPHNTIDASTLKTLQSIEAKCKEGILMVQVHVQPRKVNPDHGFLN